MPSRTFPKHVCAIQPWAFNKSQIELGTICIRACVSHAEPPRAIVVKDEVLVTKIAPIYAIPSCTI